MDLRKGTKGDAPVRQYRNAYDAYYEERKKAFSNLPMRDAKKKGSKEWNSMSGTEKAPFYDAYNESEENFKIACHKFGNKTSGVSRPFSKGASSKPKRPTPPASAFLRWMNDNRKTIAAQNPTAKGHQVSKLAG